MTCQRARFQLNFSLSSAGKFIENDVKTMGDSWPKSIYRNFGRRCRDNTDAFGRHYFDDTATGHFLEREILRDSYQYYFLLPIFRAFAYILLFCIPPPQELFRRLFDVTNVADFCKRLMPSLEIRKHFAYIQLPLFKNNVALAMILRLFSQNSEYTQAYDAPSPYYVPITPSSLYRARDYRGA